MSEPMFRTKICYPVSYLMLHTKMGNVWVYVTHEYEMFLSELMVHTKKKYVRTYVAHENMIFLVQNDIKYDYVIYLNICYPWKYDVFCPNVYLCVRTYIYVTTKCIMSEALLHTKIWSLVSEFMLHSIHVYVMSEHTFHTNMRFVLSELVLYTKMCNVRSYVTHEYEMFSVRTYVIRICPNLCYTRKYDVLCVTHEFMMSCVRTFVTYENV